MQNTYLFSPKPPASEITPIVPLRSDQLKEFLVSQDARTVQWVKSTQFDAQPGRVALIPNEQGHLMQVLVGLRAEDDFNAFAQLPDSLPQGIYHIDSTYFDSDVHYFRALYAWGTGAYRFSRYTKKAASEARLFVPESMDTQRLMQWIETSFFVRDLINTPAEDMSPSQLTTEVMELGKQFDATVRVIRGDDLLQSGYAAIHAVGRASIHPPCLIDLNWGDPDAPKVTLVGKGVCFDSGGLDIKPAANMLLMKKDMGGAAHALGLARMVMAQKLNIRLRVLIPAVENAVGSKSFRPGDVLVLREGISVEVTNTDAEGRLVLADAIAEAVQESPKLLIDFSTLTGAARVALGAEIPAFFTNKDRLSTQLLAAAALEQDLVWRLPLHAPYRSYLKSDIADIANASTQGYAGAITAALFLEHFVPEGTPWVHFDMSAWNYDQQPGRSVGAEMMALRAVFSMLEKQF